MVTVNTKRMSWIKQTVMVDFFDGLIIGPKT